MADDKVLVSSDSTSNPEFIQELLPSAQQTALLYHMTYLCLGSFPEMERLIRMRALETQLLFGSSEAVLMKCVGTSRNLITSLLPSLKVAAEKNKPQLALKFLEKAKGWINDIIRDVDEIVKKYNEHNHIVCETTSEFNKEKEEAKKKQQQQTNEMQELQKTIDGLDAEYADISKKIKDYEQNIEKKNSEIRELISKITTTTEENKRHTNTEEHQLRTLRADLSKNTEAQKLLKEEEWDIQNKLTDNRLKLAELKLENGQVPDVISLDEVQMCLSRIQQILVQLQKFWEKVGSLLDTVKESTFAGEIWIEDLTDMKEEFLKSIEDATEGWTTFGISCSKANKIFSVQTNQAYRFLEISPSSMSKEERQKEYESVKEKLEKIRPNAVNPAAITL